ncbi:MAG: XRE family transcriptional regulator [Hyphomicrobiaceae bacterium]
MSITGSQARAARALVQIPVQELARVSRIEAAAIIAFEIGTSAADDDTKRRLRHALEESGAVFVAEDDAGGIGVRLKYTRNQVRAINRWEGEGGPVGEDDI